MPGQHDDVVPELASMARDRPGQARLAFSPGCSPMPFFEDPERYLEVIQQFLADSEAPR